MKTPVFLNLFQNKDSSPLYEQQDTERLPSQSDHPPAKILEKSNPIGIRKVANNRAVNYVVSKVMQPKLSDADSESQSKVTGRLTVFRSSLEQPDQLLKAYPDLETNPIIYALARQEESQTEIKALCKARLDALKKYYTRNPVITLLKETAGWAARKVASLFSKKSSMSTFQEIKALESKLERFKENPDAWLKSLEKFENEQGLVSLSDTISAHLYFPPDETAGLLPLSVHAQSSPHLLKQFKTTLEKSRLSWVSLNRRKKQHREPSQTRVHPQTEAPPPTPASTATSDTAATPDALIDMGTRIKQQIKHWHHDCNEKGISRLAYMHINQHGLIGRLFDDNPTFAEQVLQKRLKNLRQDLSLTFSNWFTRRRKQASADLDKLDPLFEQVKANPSDSAYLETFLNALQQYEHEFDKKSFTLMFDMAFLQQPDSNQVIDFLTVTKYTGILDRATHDRTKEQIQNLASGDSHTAINGLYLSEESHPEAPVSEEPPPVQMDGQGLLSHTLSTDVSNHKSPITASGAVLDIHSLLKRSLDHNPEKVRQLAKSFMPKPISEADSAALIAPIDSEEGKELFYSTLSAPAHQPILSFVQKTLVQDHILEQLATLEPALIKDMLQADLDSQLRCQHNPEQAEKLQYLLSLPSSSPETKKVLLTYINQQANSDLKHNLQLKVNRYYFSALSQSVNEVSEHAGDISRDQLLKSLNACDTIKLLYDDTLSDKSVFRWLGTYEHDSVIPSLKKLEQRTRLLEAEFAWKYIKDEQFTPFEERAYVLPCPSKKAFIELATAKDSGILSTASHWLRWAMSPNSSSDSKPRKQDAEIVQKIAYQYLPALRKTGHQSSPSLNKKAGKPFHTDLLRFQKQRFDLLSAQKQYAYTEARKEIAGMPRGELIPNGNLERYKAYLTKIERLPAMIRPSESVTESIHTVLSKITGRSDYLSAHAMLDDIEWHQQLKELDYDYYEEFKKRTGTEFKTPYQRIKGLTQLGLNKITQTLNIGHSLQATTQQIHQVSEPMMTEQEAVKKLLEDFVNKTMNHLNTIRAVARRNPVLFRKTFGEIASLIPSIARQLGFEELVSSPMMQNFEAQKFATEFIGNPEEGPREEQKPLTEADKEWIRHIQFVHDAAIDFMDMKHRLTIAKHAVTKGLTAFTAAGAAAVAGPTAGLSVVGLVTGMPSLLSGAAKMISPVVSKNLIDNMSSQSLTFAHDVTNDSSSLDIATLVRTLGYAAEKAPHLTSDKPALSRLFNAGKVLAYHVCKPISALKSQFNVIHKAFHEGRFNDAAKEILPVAVVFLGSAAAAACAGISVFLTFGLSAPVFFAALGAFVFASGKLSSTLLHQNYSDRITSDAITAFREQLFRPNSSLAKKVKSLCSKQAERLFSGHLITSEAFQFLEQQDTLRSYYKQYWKQYCQQQLAQSNLNAEDLSQIEQQAENEFDRWFQKIDISPVAKEVSQKLQALHHIDAFLQLPETEESRQRIASELQKLNILSSLPEEASDHFLRMLRDELSEYIHLEYGEIPDTKDPVIIKTRLVERYKEAFFGNKVKMALAVTDHPEWDNFETIAKKRFQQSHCKRIAIRAEDQIKAFINEPLQPLSRLTSAQVAESHYDPAVFEETIGPVLEDSIPVSEDNDLFADALEHLYNPAGSSVDPEAFNQLLSINEPVKTAPVTTQQPIEEDDDDIFVDASDQPYNPEGSPVDPAAINAQFVSPPKPPSPTAETACSYDQIKEKIKKGAYQHDQGAAELAKDYIQLSLPEDCIKTSLQTPEEDKEMQEILGCSQDDMQKLNDYVVQVNIGDYSIKAGVTLPHFIKNLLKVVD